MMVLSRKKNESIIINGNIIVSVVEIRGDKVRLGIESPQETSVHRQEVWAAIRGLAESPLASTSPPAAPPPFFSAARAGYARSAGERSGPRNLNRSG